jgi:hypothetical protein
MLAYIFWHRPQPHVDTTLYEDALMRFQATLARNPPPGFIAAGSFRIEAVPWLGDRPGYEDWCLVDGSWALDPLNGFAVTGHAQAPHDKAAGLMEQGQGGLYAHVGGAHVGGGSLPAGRSVVHWLTRPRGIPWQPPLEALRARAARQCLAPADGARTGRGIRRRSAGRQRDRHTTRLAIAPRPTHAALSG